MANVLSVVWIVIAYIVTATAITVWAALMLASPVDRARRRIEERPVANFFIVALIWGVSVALASALLQGPTPGAAKLLGWLILGPMLTGSVVGAAAFAHLVGARIRPKMMNDSPIAALVGGALCTTLAGLLPIIGWFVFLPIIGFISVGAGCLGLVRKDPVVVPSPVVPQQPVPPAQEPSPFLLPGQHPQQG